MINIITLMFVNKCGMRGRLYTLLRIKSEYGLSYKERLLWMLVESTAHDEYIRHLIELRDAGYIYEENDGSAISYRNRYLTNRGREYLPIVKRLYLKGLWIKNRWKILGWVISVLVSILFSLLGLLKN